MFDKEFSDLKRVLTENNIPAEKTVLTEDEEADEIVRRLATPPLPPLHQMMMPVIRRIIPGVIANEIIGVQPMTGPVGEIHTLSHRYTKEE